MPYSHDGTNYICIFDHMIMSFKPNIFINLIFRIIISRMVKWSTLAWIFFILENWSSGKLWHGFFYILKLIPIKLKVWILIHIVFNYLSSKSYVPGTFCLAVIVRKRRDTRPGVADRHLVQNNSNFNHIFCLYTSNFPSNFNSLGLFV